MLLAADYGRGRNRLVHALSPNFLLVIRRLADGLVEWVECLRNPSTTADGFRKIPTHPTAAAAATHRIFRRLSRGAAIRYTARNSQALSREDHHAIQPHLRSRGSVAAARRRRRGRDQGPLHPGDRASLSRIGAPVREDIRAYRHHHLHRHARRAEADRSRRNLRPHHHGGPGDRRLHQVRQDRAGQPRRPRQIGRGGGGAGRRTETRHRHDRSREGDALGAPNRSAIPPARAAST